MQLLLSQIVERFGGILEGEDCAITGVAAPEQAQHGDIVFYTNSHYQTILENSSASAIIRKANTPLKTCAAQIVCTDPYAYFARVSQLFNPRPALQVGIHPSAVVHPDAKIGEGCEIGAFVSIGEGTEIADHCQIQAGSIIGKHVKIGQGTRIFPRVTIYDTCEIGQSCVVHSGAIIGSDGFGMAWGGDQWIDIPQIGRVIIGNNVHIGANTTIDRGTLSDTIIANGVRLDNQIQIAHNVQIGEHTAMAACVGIAGSTKIGANCMFGGAAMVSGHLNIGDRVHISGGTLVSSSLPEAGQYTAVYPLSTHREWVRNAAQLRQIDRLRERMRELERHLTHTLSFHLAPSKQESSS